MPILKTAQPRPVVPLPGLGPCAACDIRELSVCSVLSAAEQERLRRILTTIHVEPGRTVIEEGAPAEDLFNVVAGSVKLYKLLSDGRRQITGFLFPGDFLGIALNDIYAYSAEAIEPVQLCRFPRRKLELLLAELPRLERRLFGEVAPELAAAQDQMLLLGRKMAKERLASFLLQLSSRAVKRRQAATPLALSMSRADIADYLGLTTETVSRSFTQLREAGLISKDAQNRVEIRDFAGLKALAEDGAEG